LIVQGHTTSSQRRQRRLRRLVYSGLGALILFVGVAASLAQLWNAYTKTIGAFADDRLLLHDNVATYSIDASDQLLGILRLRVATLEYGSGMIDVERLALVRKQVSGAVAALAPQTQMGVGLSVHESYAPAYSATLQFIDAVAALESARLSVAATSDAGEKARESWELLMRDAINTEFRQRDAMENAIVTYRPLAERTFAIAAVVLALFVAATCLAVYSSWRFLRAETRRFDEFERLLAAIGHDLRTPLQALTGAARLAAVSADETERRKFASIVSERAGYFSRLLDDLIDLARSHSLSFIAAPVDIGEWFATATERYRYQVEAKGLTFVSSLQGASGQIMFDAHRLTQVADNLLINAVRYTAKGSVTFAVDVTRFDGDPRGALTIRVHDTGIGIAAADQERIFLPFVRLGVAEKGIGIGLSVVSNLAKAVGGSIRVESQLGKGSVFTFTAPFTSVDQAVAESQPVSLAASTPRQDGSIKPLKTPSILVIDDDPLILEVMKPILSMMGYRADVALSGREALQLALVRDYCAVVTDIEMPTMDGFALATELRAQLRPCPALIALTAYIGRSDGDARRDVFDAILKKPFDEQRLAQLLDDASARWAAGANGGPDAMAAPVRLAG
jgi:signal transduction histidine kinase/CheY-like chemotaxis protein